MDINLITGILCFLAISYIIYLEFRNPLKKRDIFIDITISIILIIICIFQFYELDFQFFKAGKINLVIWIYVLLILMGIFYIIIVLKHHKAYLEKQKQEENLESTNDEVNENVIQEEKGE